MTTSLNSAHLVTTKADQPQSHERRDSLVKLAMFTAVVITATHSTRGEASHSQI
jgi:hypothetical protein